VTPIRYYLNVSEQRISVQALQHYFALTEPNQIVRDVDAYLYMRSSHWIHRVVCLKPDLFTATFQPSSALELSDTTAVGSCVAW
jgi:hypothetical protein